jgi:anti-sigma B factor antagonist
MNETVGFEGFIAHHDDRVAVVVRGDVDLSSALPLTALIDQALAASPHLEFDMSGVTFLDSTGLRALVIAAKRVEGTGSITIRNPTATVTRVLTLAGLTGVLPVTTDASVHSD